tara:strand:+ start:117 stop:515 length:399 start_codon:yes stop_codon:yes gene_type:complete
MNAVRPIRMAEKAVTYRAWRLTNDNCTALPLAIEENSLGEAKEAATAFLNHKDTLLIHESMDGESYGRLFTFNVVKKAAQWRRNSNTGDTERFTPLALKDGFALAIRDFNPDRPFDAFADDPVGVDRTMVRQ